MARDAGNVWCFRRVNDFVAHQLRAHGRMSGMDTADREAPPNADPRISYAVAQLQQLVLGAVNEVAVRYNLTALQFTTLSVLNHNGAPLSNSQLARRSFMTAQSMHEVINRLEGAGLIKRNAHPNHGR